MENIRNGVVAYLDRFENSVQSDLPAGMLDQYALDTERVRVSLTLKATTHQALKIWCIGRDISMQEAMENMIYDMVVKKPAAVET